MPFRVSGCILSCNRKHVSARYDAADLQLKTCLFETICEAARGGSTDRADLQSKTCLLEVATRCKCRGSISNNGRQWWSSSRARLLSPVTSRQLISIIKHLQLRAGAPAAVETQRHLSLLSNTSTSRTSPPRHLAHVPSWCTVSAFPLEVMAKPFKVHRDCSVKTVGGLYTCTTRHAEQN